MWTEYLALYQKTDDELDALCAQFQEQADGAFGVEREMYENFADTCALILEERGVIVPVCALYDEEMLLASYMASARPEGVC